MHHNSTLFQWFTVTQVSSVAYVLEYGEGGGGGWRRPGVPARDGLEEQMDWEGCVRQGGGIVACECELWYLCGEHITCWWLWSWWLWSTCEECVVWEIRIRGEAWKEDACCEDWWWQVFHPGCCWLMLTGRLLFDISSTEEVNTFLAVLVSVPFIPGVSEKSSVAIIIGMPLSQTWCKRCRRHHV